MKALVINKDHSREIRNIKTPEINDCMALVKMKACGLCGTDLKLLRGEYEGVPPEMYPIVLGHEGVGEVVEVGKNCKAFKLGDIVSCPENFAPGDGLHAFRGAFAEYAAVVDYENWDVARYGQAPEVGRIQKVLPDWMDPVDASMFDTLREPFCAMHTFGFGANESLVLYGVGAMGLPAVRLASLMGMKPVIALDIFDDKLEEAKEQGADFVIRADDERRIQKIKDICPKGIDNVLDCAGNPSIYSEAMHFIKMNGKIAAFGVPRVHSTVLDWGPVNYQFQLLFNNNVTNESIEWAHNPLLSLVRFGAIKLEDYISERIPFDHILETLDRFEKGAFSKKVLITF